MIFTTRSVFKRLVLGQKGGITINSVAPEYDYNWQVRDRSLRSCIGYVTLLGGFANYGCSIAYIYAYWAYTQAVEANNLDSITCEITSSWAILSYCTLFQALLGSLCCLIFISSCCYKSCHALGFICPVFTTRIKKTFKGLPRRYTHYINEFDFECDET